MHEFVGRKKELAWLANLANLSTGSFVVIRGRRRVGKSRLIYEFCKSKRHYVIAGLPPTNKTTKRDQLDTFCFQVARLFEIPTFTTRDWGEAFAYLGKLCANGEVVLALDEISWIGSKDSNFLGHLKNAWDQHFSRNPNLILIVCGSVSSWIQKNILSNTGFVGRISGIIDLKELSLDESAQFWKGTRTRTSCHEILQTLTVTGGIPRYLEAIDPRLPSAANIKRLCFDEKGLLFNEFDQIFSDLFTRRAASMKAILIELASGSRSSANLAQHLGLPDSTVNEGVHDLLHAGFVTEDPTWNLKTTQISRLKKFRLSDNYVRFYLKFVAPARHKIKKGTYEYSDLRSLPKWSTVMGLQFENLVLGNLEAILPHLGLQMTEVEMYGPFFQSKSTRQKGCQIDLLIQTKYRTLYVCEIKFGQEPVQAKVINEVQDKVSALTVPKNMSVRTVLIYASGITQELAQSNQIDYLIDFSKAIE